MSGRIGIKMRALALAAVMAGSGVGAMQAHAVLMSLGGRSCGSFRVESIATASGTASHTHYTGATNVFTTKKFYNGNRAITNRFLGPYRAVSNVLVEAPHISSGMARCDS